ncbi:Ig-like domain-containing protein [Brevibacillus sp. SYSU BS000544]|uniref:Ig-like domain-containing protein n=1 Tax=Brevibacillus sp. SYSU BS000544 TaxID=3416443 RepID=UPI003CE473F6
MNRSLETYTTTEETTLHGQLPIVQMEEGNCRYLLIQQPVSGQADLNEQGAFSYTPNEGFSGTDQFIVELIGVNTCCSTTILIHVTPAQDDQDFQETAIITTENTTFKGCLAGKYRGKSSYRFSLASSPRNGSVILSDDGSYIYTPKNCYCGNDSFTVFVTEDKDNTEEVQVKVTITSGDKPFQAVSTKRPMIVFPAPITITTRKRKNPIIFAPEITITEAGMSVQGRVSSKHRRRLRRSYQLHKSPANGFVLLRKNGHFLYVPAPGFVGKDYFVVIISDRLGNSLITPIEIEVSDTEEE